MSSDNRLKIQEINLKIVDSTNTFLSNFLLEKSKTENINEKYNFLIVKTLEQTKGRGQRGNFWESKKGENLIFSMVCFPNFLRPDEQFFLLKVVALSVADFVSELLKNVKIKWSNDIYVENKKIAGILIENVISRNQISQSIIGIGLNVNQIKFESEAKNPTSLKFLTNKNYELDYCLKRILHHFFKRYQELMNINFVKLNEDYLKKLYRYQKFYVYKNEQEIFLAKIIAIKDSGQLVLEKKNKEISIYNFKEIKFII